MTMRRLADLEGIMGLEFHDALIGDVRYSAEDRSLSVGLSVYETMDSERRTPAFLSVQSMDRATVRLDFPKLASNAFAGTVMNCRLDTEESVARLYLCGGLLEVASKLQSLEPSELPPSVFKATLVSESKQSSVLLAASWCLCLFPTCGVAPISHLAI